ncbi:MAG: SUMF1/EgtB/PvdO family nonheme iron enzyme [Phycisphaerae bacterium]|nr:SUMF1/EgtB/PvdO family nonheme iron enzyme [Phycisphaerae bacterium]
MFQRTVFTFALSIGLLAATLTVAQAADPEYYVKKATWQETVQASREALIVHLNKPGKPKAPVKPMFGPWYEIGQYRGGFAAANGPEKAIDLSKGDGKLKWKRIKVSDGVVHSLRLGGNSASYFYRKITSPGPAAVMSYYGSDDALAVWLNGKKIISNNVARGPGANQDKAKLILVQGENHLLIKIHNRSGGSGWYFSTSAKGGGKKDIRTAMQEGIWTLAARDFNTAEIRKQMAWEQGDNIWAADWKKGDLGALAKRYVSPSEGSSAAAKIKTLAPGAKSAGDLAAIRKLYYRAKSTQEALAQLSQFNIKALRLAITDLTKSYPGKYPGKYLKQLDKIEAAITDGGEEKIREMAQQLVSFRREALLANPLLNFDKLMMVKRKGDLGLPQNWVGNCTKRGPFNNEITVLSPVRPDGKLTTLYRPESSVFVGDVDLHWDAKKMLFSSQLKNRRYEVFEIGADGKGLRQVSKSLDGIDNYDACYLPSGKIIFDSTAVYQGVPCVGGGSQVANLYVMNPDGTGMRQLCFDQDHNWYPSITNDGRVLFTRWEYSDTPHYFTRVVMGMNPDGTNQRSVYGSNSYWPNSTFYVRAVPNHSSRFVGIISGHHGVPRMGELILFDPAKGQQEADGVVQRIPGYGKKVEPIIRDALVNNSWPRFLHPFPLSDKYILTTCKLNSKSPWGVYLVDVFDNILPICVQDGVAMFEPLPLRKTKRPPVIPERVDLARKDAIIHMSDIYIGGGLKGVQRGAVKKLRLFAFDYGYHNLANHTYIGIEGPWDVHRILGTVDVESDGSSSFHVPANTPIAVQPLDENGAAMQLMRSWFVAMPGENLSCVGCHENNNEAPPAAMVKASRKPPQKVKDWYGPARGFSFAREVQPVIDKYCIGCHNDKPRKGTNPPDLRHVNKKGFSTAYRVLQKHVRRPGPESDYHMFPPLEYHASTSPLIQMLKKGHNNVKPDAEAYERIYAWIDLNVPYYGTWGEFRAIPRGQREKRSKFRQLYAGIDADYEVVPKVATKPVKTILPKPLKTAAPVKIACPNWPFDDAAAKTLQGNDNKRTITVTVGENKLQIEMVRIPAGQFVMGDAAGALDEKPICRVKLDKSFWIATKIITNGQYALFDAKHDSRYLDRGGKDHSNRGHPLNRPEQPVIRISWNRAMAFCDWMSKKTGKTFSLPTEAQWEFACRAGAAADKSGSGSVWGAGLPAAMGEWTRTTYRPYPYIATDGRDNGKPAGRKVIRGAKGLKVPGDRRDTYRLSYQSWQGVWNVGFRVICLDEDLKSIIANAKPR